MNFRSPQTWLPIGLLFFSPMAFANVNLKGVQITEGSQVELIFDGKFDVNQVKTEFVREHIQLSLLRTSVYPAKVNLVQGKELTKVFAYQYAPELVRCRLTMKGDASKFQNRLQVKVTGKTLVVRILPETAAAETVTTSRSSADRPSVISEASAAEPMKEMSKESVKEAKEAKEASQELSNEEKVLVEKVTKKEKTNEKTSEKSNEKGNEKASARLTTSKHPPSTFRWVGMVLFVFGILGTFLFFLKRVKDSGQSKGLKSFLGKLGGNIGQKKVISVVATLPLGPKKSITVVQIQNRMLVLGMSNDSVNLITEFKADEDDNDLAESMNLKDFADGLKGLDEPKEKNVFSALLAKASSDEGPRPPVTSSVNLINAALNATKSAGLNYSSHSSVTPRSAAQVGAYRAASDARAPEVNARNAGPAFNELMKDESNKTSIRAQIKSRVEGMKRL